MTVETHNPPAEEPHGKILFEVASTIADRELRVISSHSQSESFSGLLPELVGWALQHFQLKARNGLLLTHGYSDHSGVGLLAGLKIRGCLDTSSCNYELQRYLRDGGPIQIKTIFLPCSPHFWSKADALQIIQHSNANFLRDEDRRVCYRMINTLDFDLVMQEQKCLANDEDMPPIAPREPSDGSWRRRLSQKSCLKTEGLASSQFCSVSKKLEALKSQRESINQEARVVLEHFIAESFSTSIDVEFNATESFEAMRDRAAVVRDWLKEFDWSLLNPKNGLPCQPFAERTRKHPRYVLSPLGADRPAKTVDRRIVGSALLKPQLVNRPDPVQHAFGRSR